MTQFEIQSTQMRVTDPCYDKDTWCAGVLENVLPGTWVAEKEVSDEGSWGMRIARLRVYHENYTYTEPRELTPIDVGVDSGQAGFFDESQYPEGSTGDYGDMNTMYGQVCAGTAGDTYTRLEYDYPPERMAELEERLAKIPEASREAFREMLTTPREREYNDYLSIANVGYGVATSSGYGDGGYNCYVGRNKDGQIVAAEIVFISDEPEEDDWCEDDEGFDFEDQ